LSKLNIKSSSVFLAVAVSLVEASSVSEFGFFLEGLLKRILPNEDAASFFNLIMNKFQLVLLNRTSFTCYVFF